MKFDDPPTGHDFSDGLSHSNLNNLRCVFRPRGILQGRQVRNIRMTGAKKSWTCSNASRCFEFRSLGPKVFSDQSFFGSSIPLKRAAPNHHSAWRSITSCFTSPVRYHPVMSCRKRASVTHLAGMMQTPRRDGRGLNPVGAVVVLFVGRAQPQLLYRLHPSSGHSGFSLHIQSDCIIILYHVIASELVDVVFSYWSCLKCGGFLFILWMAAKSCTSR